MLILYSFHYIKVYGKFMKYFRLYASKFYYIVLERLINFYLNGIIALPVTLPRRIIVLRFEGQFGHRNYWT